MPEEKKELPEWWILQCKCRTFITDYPFVSCPKCGMTFCGSEEQLKAAEKNGTLIKCLETGKSGLGEPDIPALSKKHGVPIENSMMDADQYADPEDSDEGECGDDWGMDGTGGE